MVGSMGNAMVIGMMVMIGLVSRAVGQLDMGVVRFFDKHDQEVTLAYEGGHVTIAGFSSQCAKLQLVHKGEGGGSDKIIDEVDCDSSGQVTFSLKLEKGVAFGTYVVHENGTDSNITFAVVFFLSANGSKDCGNLQCSSGSYCIINESGVECSRLDSQWCTRQHSWRQCSDGIPGNSMPNRQLVRQWLASVQHVLPVREHDKQQGGGPRVVQSGRAGTVTAKITKQPTADGKYTESVTCEPSQQPPPEFAVEINWFGTNINKQSKQGNKIDVNVDGTVEAEVKGKFVSYGPFDPTDGVFEQTTPKSPLEQVQARPGQPPRTPLFTETGTGPTPPPPVAATTSPSGGNESSGGDYKLPLWLCVVIGLLLVLVIPVVIIFILVKQLISSESSSGKVFKGTSASQRLSSKAAKNAKGGSVRVDAAQSGLGRSTISQKGKAGQGERMWDDW